MINGGESGNPEEDGGFPPRSAGLVNFGESDDDSMPAGTAEGSPPVGAAASPLTIAQLLAEHADFVWRSLRRLGVPMMNVDDATQNVFIIAQQKLDQIPVGHERGFLFRVALNVAAHVRRSFARRREVSEGADEVGQELVDPRPLPDAELDQQRARALVDRILDDMADDVRTVFVMFELEEMSMSEIAVILDIPPGTVASRLRRGRDDFRRLAGRLRARMGGTR